jgi:TRAP-type uncharacterized transport system substrate-binding protein
MGAKRILGPDYPTAGGIADALNREHGRHGMCITVRMTRPSAPIVASVLSGEFEFSGVPLNRIHQAYRGWARWDGRPQSVLRNVPGIFHE